MADLKTYGVYDYWDYIKGSSTESIIFTLTDQNDNPINLTDINAFVQFRKSNETGALVKDFSVGNGITLVDASNGVIQIDSFIIDFEVGIYFYDLKIEFNSNKIKTYIKGSLKVLQNVNKNC